MCVSGQLTADCWRSILLKSPSLSRHATEGAKLSLTQQTLVDICSWCSIIQLRTNIIFLLIHCWCQEKVQSENMYYNFTEIRLPLHSNVDSHLTLVWVTTSQKYGFPLHRNVDLHLTLVWATTSQKYGFPLHRNVDLHLTSVWATTSQKYEPTLHKNMGSHSTEMWTLTWH